jgi:hypothetical protein
LRTTAAVKATLDFVDPFVAAAQTGRIKPFGVQFVSVT